MNYQRRDAIQYRGYCIQHNRQTDGYDIFKDGVHIMPVASYIEGRWRVDDLISANEEEGRKANG